MAEMIWKTVQLTTDESERLELIRMAGTPDHDALTELTDAGADRSEASVLRALFSLGLDTVRERAFPTMVRVATGLRAALAI